MGKPTNKTLPVSANEFRFTTELNVEAARAWKAMIKDVHAWWPKDFLCAGQESQMRFDLRLGGALIEESKSGNGIVWYHIIALDAPRSLTMSGFIAPPFGGPATTALRLSIQPVSKTGCVLEVHNSQFGHIADCDVESGWKTIFESFARYLNTPRTPAVR